MTTTVTTAQRYREEGRCSETNCHRWPAPGFKTCQHHLDYRRRTRGVPPNTCSVEGCDNLCKPRAKVCPEHKGMRGAIQRAAYRAEGRCSNTGCPRWPEPGRKQCAVHLDYHREYARATADVKNMRTTLHARKTRMRVIEAYGGKCCMCGEADPIVLELDHVHGLNSVPDGWPRGGVVLHRKIIRAGFPQGLFQVLCANCHRRKTFANISVAYEEASIY